MDPDAIKATSADDTHVEGVGFPLCPSEEYDNALDSDDERYSYHDTALQLDSRLGTRRCCHHLPANHLNRCPKGQRVNPRSSPQCSHLPTPMASRSGVGGGGDDTLYAFTIGTDDIEDPELGESLTFSDTSLMSTGSTRASAATSEAWPEFLEQFRAHMQVDAGLSALSIGIAAHYQRVQTGCQTLGGFENSYVPRSPAGMALREAPWRPKHAVPGTESRWTQAFE